MQFFYEFNSTSQWDCTVLLPADRVNVKKNFIYNAISTDDGKVIILTLTLTQILTLALTLTLTLTLPLNLTRILTLLDRSLTDIS